MKKNLYKLLYFISRNLTKIFSKINIFKVKGDEKYKNIIENYDHKELYGKDTFKDEPISKEKYDLSIIVPVYNSEKYLEKCLNSLINQKTKYKYQIICINDGSTDKSLEILKNYKKKLRIEWEKYKFIHAYTWKSYSYKRNEIFSSKNIDLILDTSYNNLKNIIIRKLTWNLVNFHYLDWKGMILLTIHLYAKLQEPLSIFDNVIKAIKKEQDELLVTSENKRSFISFNEIKKIDDHTIFVVSSLNSLGLNDADIAAQLSWFIDNSVKLVICDVTSTYEFGVTQPMNQAVLNTILESILSDNKNVVTVSFKRANSGRNKLPFPDNWDELYEKWRNGEISSKQFIEKSGLKKATFYNLLTEYKDIQVQNEKYLKRYKII